MAMFVGGCKKDKGKVPNNPSNPGPSCIGQKAFLAGKYIQSSSSTDTMYIDLLKNLCPTSTFNEYVVRNYDSIMNKNYRVPWGNFIITSTKEDSVAAFAKGQNLVVGMYVQNNRIRISATYNNSVSEDFIKIQ